MRKLAQCLSLTLPAFLSALCPLAAEDDLSPLLHEIQEEYNLPAVGAVVVKNGEVVAIGVAGTRALGQDNPAEIDDLFHLGSNAKAMTATVAGAMVDAGKLRWDSTLGEVLGEKVPEMSPELAAVTLDQLLSHASGIPSDTEEMIDIYFNARNYDYPVEEQRLLALKDYASTIPVVPEGSPFQYSNFGYMLAAAMIDEVSGTTTETLYHTLIFEPLGLESAGFGPPATTGLYDAPVAHRPIETEDGIVITPVAWGEAADVPAILWTVGGVHLDLRDYAKWAAWNASLGQRDPAIVEPETLAIIQSEKVHTPSRPNPRPGTPKEGGYAYGWGNVAFDWAPNPLLQHNGSNGMNLAKILIDTENDIAVGGITNIGGNDAEVALARIQKELYLHYLDQN